MTLFDSATSVDSWSLTGCVYSSILTPHFELPTGLGKVDPDIALRHYHTLRKAGFGGTPVYIIDPTGMSTASGISCASDDVITGFRQRFGDGARA